jgi:hypothetical protein
MGSGWWSRIWGRKRAVMGTIMTGWNVAVNPEAFRAVEYLKVCHDEEDGEGRKQRPHLPGVSDGTVTVRPLRDKPEDLALLAGWIGESGAALPDGRHGPTDLAEVRRVYLVDLPAPEVPCVVEVEGRPVGYLTLAFPGPDSAAFRLQAFLGAACDRRAVRLLMAYLFEMEGARLVEVLVPVGGEEACRACGFQPIAEAGILAAAPEQAQPASVPFYLLVQA